MEFYQIRYFVTVAETKSYQLAAKELFVTRQAIGKAILQLEEELGYALFLRTKTGIRLTPQADSFLGQARSVVEAMDDLEAAMIAGVQQRMQHVRLNCAFTTYALNEQALDSFRSEHLQTLNLEIHNRSEQVCRQQLLDGTVDMAITTTPMADCPCRVFAEYPISMLMSASHPLASKDSITISDCAGQTFLAYQSGTDDPLYLPPSIRYGGDGIRCICSDDLMYLFRCIHDKRAILLSVEENMKGMLDGVVFRPFESAGTWAHYLSLSPAASAKPELTALYEALFQALRR